MESARQALWVITAPLGQGDDRTGTTRGRRERFHYDRCKSIVPTPTRDISVRLGRTETRGTDPTVKMDCA